MKSLTPNNFAATSVVVQFFQEEGMPIDRARPSELE